MNGVGSGLADEGEWMSVSVAWWVMLFINDSLHM